MQLFRVWDKKNNCYSKEDLLLDKDGEIWAPYENKMGTTSHYPVWDYKNYEVEFNTGLKLENGRELFEGDIIRMTDSNYFPGKHTDGVMRDGYEYMLLTKNVVIDRFDWCLLDKNGIFSDDVELVGNIHETELTDTMKIWIKE